MSISSYNKFNRKFDVELKDLSFVKLSDLYKESPDKEYTITGLFINKKSKFGDRPFVSTPDFLADLPAGMLGTVRDMVNDPVVVEAINEGTAGFKVVKYHSNRYNRDCYTVEFVELANF